MKHCPPWVEEVAIDGVLAILFYLLLKETM